MSTRLISIYCSLHRRWQYVVEVLHKPLIVAAIFTYCVQPQQSTGQDYVDDLHGVSQTFFDASGFPGLSVSVGVDGKLAYSEGFGFSDIEQNVSVTPGISLFRIGSVSKSMTAMAVGQLVEKGMIDLDLPVQTYVPDFPIKRGVITTRLVGGHLAGVRHYRGSEFYSQKKYNTVSEGLEIFQADPLLFEPGTQYSYSSYGWNLISAIVENASGIDFLDYMADSVFVPTGMIRTVADHSDRLIPNRTRYYIRDGGELRLAPNVDNSYKWAGGGFLSTTEDLIRFGYAHLEGHLSDDTLKELWTPQNTTDGNSTGYGIGWASGTDDNGRYWVGHNGGSVGGSTRFRIYPDINIIIAVVTNMSGAPFESLIDDLANVFLQD